MTVDEFDTRLEAANARLRDQVLAAEERNRQLESLLAEKDALAAHREAVWSDA